MVLTIKRITAALLFSLFFSLFGFACGASEQSKCEQYCEKAEECAEIANRMFSVFECHSECRKNKERHESIDCLEELYLYYDCLIEAPCSLWLDEAETCKLQLEDVGACVEMSM